MWLSNCFIVFINYQLDTIYIFFINKINKHLQKNKTKSAQKGFIQKWKFFEKYIYKKNNNHMKG